MKSLLFVLLFAAGAAFAADYPAPTEGDYLIRDFRFASGETVPELRIHYRTLGKLARDRRNAVLILHGTTGSGASLMRAEFAGELFGPGQLLDASRYFIVLPDGIGHGKSSKPSDGLRTRFPRYAYEDMVEAQYKLMTQHFRVERLRLVMGTSMGGMHTWLWGERHAGIVDALMPLASLPTQVSGRNRVWRRLVSDAIRNDPAWKNGEYDTQPPATRTAVQMLWLMGSNPVLRQQDGATRETADAAIDAYVADQLRTADANDILYAVESSRDYDPGPGLEQIRAPLMAVNSADDLINPPELGILEREIGRVPNGRAVVIPLSEHTRGHGSHTIASLWKAYLEELLRKSDPAGGS
jgi:homoserine O-acetyltransferase